MKTNQTMCVKINQDLTIRIGHLTKMGRVDEIITYGNLLRELRGLRPIKIEDILKTRDFWEFVIAMNTALENEKLKKSKGQNCPFENSDNPNVENSTFDFYSDYSKLEQYIDNKGRVKYSQLIKQFPTLIKSVRGGKVENRGHYMHLNLLLKIATILDKDLEAQIYMIFIEGKILEHRDAGVKRLNKAIDTLPDRQPHLKPKGNKGVYINVAKMIREKLSIIDTKGYNEDEHDKVIQEKREEYINKLVSFIEIGFITSYPQLKETIKKL